MPQSDADTHTNRGTDLLNNRQYDEARAEFERALLTLNSAYGEAHRGIGLVHLHTQQYAHAINAFQQAIQFKPNYKEAHYGLGLTYFESGDNAKATAAAKAALRIDPHYQPAHQLLAIIKSKTSSPISASRAKPKPPREPATSSPISASRAKPKPPREPTPDPSATLWQHIIGVLKRNRHPVTTGTLGLALVVCFIAFLTQMDAKDTTLSQNTELTKQLSEKTKEVDRQRLEIQDLTSSVQTLKSSNQKLSRDNSELQKKLDDRIFTTNQLSPSSTKTLPERITTAKDGRDMVLIPAGNFQMGSDDQEARPAEQPVHTVFVDAFYMDTHEVTNADYQQFVLANPEWQKDRVDAKYHNGDYLKLWDGTTYPAGKGDHPVVYVSWYAAMAYSKWAGKRLPSEAEWEKSARGGLVGMRYPWGNEISGADANYGDAVGDTTVVGSYAANGYGLYDMVGNVWEWCLDAWDSDFYSHSPDRNPLSDVNNIAQVDLILNDYLDVKSRRVLRGGSWYSDTQFVRVARRSTNAPTSTSTLYGFRCARAAVTH